MNVYLKANSQDLLPGDLVLSWVLRSDLAPVPRTLEMTLQVKDGLEARLTEGARLWTGRELLEYRIVKVERDLPVAMVQGSDPLAAIRITALLASCAEVAFRRARAVVREGATLGELYRSCGASAAIGNDLPVPLFVCFAGQVPSIELAKVMQEQGAALVYRGGRLSLLRVADLARQEPVKRVEQVDSTDGVQSEFLRRHEIPAFYSLTAAGGFTFGARENARAIQYMPRANEITLRNATRVLVTRRIMDSAMAQEINAGDVVQVAGAKLVVITAAHVMERVEGVAETNTRLWLGEVSK